MGILKMVKSWAIAVGLFIVGGFMAFFWGKRKQYVSDQVKQAQKESAETTNVVSIAAKTRANISGDARSAVDQLRDNWSAE